MAIGNISIAQEPVEDASKIPAITNWTPVLPYTVVQTSITDLFFFKFILEIRIDDASGELLAKIKQRPNGNTTGTTFVRSIFNLRDIINTQLENTYADQNSTTNSIHTLGANLTSKIFSNNSNQLKKIFVKAYQEYSAGATVSPTENTSENATDDKYYIAASLPLETPRGTTYFQGTAFQDFQAGGTSKKFLSDVQKSYNEYIILPKYNNYVQWDDSTNVGDFHTVAFLNDVTNFDSDIDIIEIKYYDSSNSQIGATQQIKNELTKGGANPTSSTTVAQKLLYFGCGPGNLQASTVTPEGGSSGDARPSNFSNWVYYTVQGKDATATPAASTDRYYFVKQDTSCKGFKVRRLAWRNSLGCWDYYNFKMKSTQTVDVKRDTFGKVLGEFNSSAYSYNNFDSTQQVRKTDAILKETLNTDWIAEEDAELLEKCIVSTDVFIIENADTTYTVPVLITDKSIARKTNANDGMKIQYTIKIEYANPLNTNN